MNMITMTGSEVFLHTLKAGDKFKVKNSSTVYVLFGFEDDKVIALDEAGKEREFFEGSPVRPIKSY
jgi:hypothetical protein